MTMMDGKKIIPVTLGVNLKNPIAEIREIAQALNDLAVSLEEIERKYADLGESEVSNADRD